MLEKKDSVNAKRSYVAECLILNKCSINVNCSYPYALLRGENWDREARSPAQGHTAREGRNCDWKPGPCWDKDRKGAERETRVPDDWKVIAAVQLSPVGFHPLRVRDHALLGAHNYAGGRNMKPS